MRNSFRKTIKLIKSDYYWFYGREISIVSIFIDMLKTKYKGQGWVSLLRFSQCSNCVVSFIAKVIKQHYAHKYCIDIPACIKVGYSFHIGHGYGVVIHGDTIIGDNVSVSQFVNIGSTDNEHAVIGNNVYIGPMSCIIGGVRIGNDVTIGAGSIVTKDIPDGATVAGNPAKILNFDNPGRKISGFRYIEDCI